MLLIVDSSELPMWLTDGFRSLLLAVSGEWRIHVNSHVEGTFMCGPYGGYIHVWQVLMCCTCNRWKLGYALFVYSDRPNLG